jgi:hypothetical protein
MARTFTDDDLQVDLQLNEVWSDAFVRAHGKENKTHGQVKLLWSNLLGLALVEQHMQDEDRPGGPDTRKIVLVVAGASPGTHMLLLLKHVQRWRKSRRVEIHLYDPKALDHYLWNKVSSDSSMHFKRDCFTDADAEYWFEQKRDDCLVFFSDIRSDIHSKHEHVGADETKIAADMRAQKQWVETMQPDYCMLKFHAPHATTDRPCVPESVKYLDGVLYEQAYAGLFSAEYRLFCTQADIGETKEYSTADIEGHAFCHTHTTRPTTFVVREEQMLYDDAFAAHVAHKAQELGLIRHADSLLSEAPALGHVAHMHFSWPAAQSRRLQGMHLRMLQIL